MNYSLVFAAAILLLLVLYYGQIYLSRYKLIGELNPLKKESDNAWQLYYFHSPHSGACKSLTPVIIADHQQVNIIDISSSLDIVRKFNIRATPTVVFIEGDIVTNVHLGTDAIQHIKEFIQKHES